jgi:hypothetical protein
MLRRTHPFVAGLCLALIPLAATAEENFGAILQALPGPVPVVTSPSCLTDGADAEAVADPAFLAEYAIPFDEEAGKAVLAYLDSAIAAAPGSAVAPPGPDDFQGQTPTQAFTKAYSKLGLDPTNVLDVATLYLAAAWAAQKGEVSALVSLDANRLAAVKAQLVGGEQRCAFLIGVKDDLAAQRNQMIALTGILIDGMESHSRSDTLDALAADARKVFADQTDGLRLTERGFVSP